MCGISCASVCATLLLALAAGAPATEIHCVGRVAHLVTYTGDGGLREGSLSIEPAPAENAGCLESGAGFDRRICLGANQDETCAAAKRRVIPLAEGSRCQDCFAGVETDVYYTLNMTESHIQYIGVGFRGTQLRAAVRVEDDTGSAPAMTGALKFGQKPLEWAVRVLGRTLFVLKVAMPTEIFYDFTGRDGAHGDVGASVAVDVGGNYIEYVKGRGWSHHKDEAKVTVTPIHEGDFNAMANVTVGVRSHLSAEVGEFMWFHLDMSPEVPLTFTSIGTSGGDLVHSCVDARVKFDVSHEAQVSAGPEHKHWGPVVDRHYRRSLAHKCVDEHPGERGPVAPPSGGSPVLVLV